MRRLMLSAICLSIAIPLLNPVQAQEEPRTAKGEPYSAKDFGPLPPSSAIYFMDGESEATIRFLATGKEMTFKFRDQGTSITASAPKLLSDAVKAPLFVPAPSPLRPLAEAPTGLPDEYQKEAVVQLLQVVSMNMRAEQGGAGLLIGLPYAEKYPEIFFNKKALGNDRDDASSFGMVHSLVTADGGRPETKDTSKAGYPARSVFDVLHIVETPLGAYFNKKPTRMELQSDKDGKLALTLPPIPFSYRLVNGPIPLFDVKNPDGKPVAEIIAAHHDSGNAMPGPREDSWPAHQPNIGKILSRVRNLNQ